MPEAVDPVDPEPVAAGLAAADVPGLAAEEAGEPEDVAPAVLPDPFWPHPASASTAVVMAAVAKTVPEGMIFIFLLGFPI
ncbi:MAG: hypothetical protein ABSF03_11080 [Streptosporangiaceae bacterium]